MALFFFFYLIYYGSLMAIAALGIAVPRRWPREFVLISLACVPLSQGGFGELPISFPVDAIAVFLLLYGLEKLLKGQFKLRRNVWLGLLALLLAWQGIGLIPLEQSGPAAVLWGRHALWALAFAWLLPAMVRRQGFYLSQVALALLIPVIIAWIYGAVEHPYPKNFTMPFFRNDNTSAVILAMVLPVFAYEAFFSPKRKSYWNGWLILFGICLTLLVLSFSRGALLASACSALLAGVLYAPRLGKWIALILLVLGGFWAGKSVLEYGSPPERFANGAEFSSRERVLRWRLSLRMAEDAPVLGIGYGQYPGAFRKYLQSEEELRQISYWFGFTLGAHSEYLDRLAETGVPGGLLWVLLLLGPCVALWQKKGLGDRGKVLLVSLLSFAIAALFNTFLEEAGVAIAFWVLWGLACLELGERNTPQEATFVSKP